MPTLSISLVHHRDRPTKQKCFHHESHEVGEEVIKYIGLLMLAFVSFACFVVQRACIFSPQTWYHFNSNATYPYIKHDLHVYQNYGNPLHESCLAVLTGSPTKKKSGYRSKKKFINDRNKAKCMPSRNCIAVTPRRKSSLHVSIECENCE
jgi:hypothetical protein